MSISGTRNVSRSRRQKTLNVAMVGHGFMGRAHANAMRQVNRFFDLPYRVVPKVVVGLTQEEAEEAREKLGFEEASGDIPSVLARDDIHHIDVVVPNDLHHTVAMQALKAGKHVTVEKPLALTLQQAKQMAAEARKRKAKVGLWHNYRRTPATRLAARMIARGDIGKVRQVRAVYLQDWLASDDAPASWRTVRAVCGSGALGDLNAHLVDLIFAMTGLRFAEVCAMEQTFTKTRKTAEGKRQRVDVDDAFAFLARFEGGAIGTVEATRMAAGRKNYNCVEINGTKGSIVWNLERMNELQFFSFEDPADARGFRTIMCMDESHPYAANWWPDGHIIGYEHTFVNHLADFVLSLGGRKRFEPDFDDGVKVQAVLEAAAKSAKSGRWAKVPS